LKGIEVGWAGDKGKELEIIGWLRRKGKLGGEAKAMSEVKSKSPSPAVGVKGDNPQSKTRPSDSTAYSSFPSTFPNFPTSPPSPPLSTKPVVAGLDYRSSTLMRMRQTQRERLEREILEQEANS